MNWITWVLLGLLWISSGNSHWWNKAWPEVRKCLVEGNTRIVVPDNFNGAIKTTNHWNHTNGCIIFLQKNGGNEHLLPNWPQMNTANSLILSSWHTKRDFHLYILQGRQCNATLSTLTESVCDTGEGLCQITCLDTKTVCQQTTFDENKCKNKGLQVNDRYIVNITGTNKECLNCNNPVKSPEVKVDLSYLDPEFSSINISEGEEFNAAKANNIMNKMSDLIASINVSSAEVTVGGGVTGVLKINREPEDVDEVSFAYVSPNDSINIIESGQSLTLFSRSVTVPKEAFEKSCSMNISVPFAAVFRFTNLAKDEMNSSVLGNEVLAVEMGTMIMNLTDKICINFRNMKFRGIPACQSWNGEGSRPNWTGDGCQTIQNGTDIQCYCSHLTFFAILLTPLNETTSSSDLNILTIITQVGCGLSMFFLSIVLFMHFLLRKTKASKATRIFIHLVSAMFLLNFTFLINNFVAKLKSSVGCKIMAALMHYFLLATFTWFAVQAFHLCLQLYMMGKVVIRHYILKVSIISWVLPSVIGIVLLIIGKYGEQVINTSDTDENVAICWITDSNVHSIVNIGYYALVFLFTFTTFIIMLSWLFCLKGTNIGNAQYGTNGKRIATILGLCCMLGITWGFAFFAYGILRIPAYYIFTVLNSFQGFFLFIYYYNTCRSGGTNGGERDDKNTSSTSSTTTLKTRLDSFNNPYFNMPGKK